VRQPSLFSLWSNSSREYFPVIPITSSADLDESGSAFAGL
jgi:hypothetical protein